MNLESAADWSRIASVILAVVQLVIAGGMLYLRKEFVGQKACDGKCREHQDVSAKLEQRQTTIEQAQAMAPTIKEMAAIKDQLAELSGEIKGMSATTTAQTRAMERVTHQLDLLLENELNGGK